MTTRPNSVRASLISRIRIRSRVLLDTRRSFSLTCRTVGSKWSSALCLRLATPPEAFKLPLPMDPRAPPRDLEVEGTIGVGDSEAVDEGCSIAKGS
eukprot:03952.XXX_36025_36312_1 [CDS] Oithona nana genome sequencing.